MNFILDFICFFYSTQLSSRDFYVNCQSIRLFRSKIIVVIQNFLLPWCEINLLPTDCREAPSPGVRFTSRLVDTRLMLLCFDIFKLVLIKINLEFLLLHNTKLFFENRIY